MKVGDNNIIRRPPPEERSGKGNKVAVGKEPSVESHNIGQLVKAKVLSINQAGQALFSIGGKLVTLNDGNLLKAGQEVWLEVVKDANGPTVSLAGKKGVIIDLLRLMAGPGGGGTSVGNLKSSILLKLPNFLVQENLKVPQPLEDLVRLFSDSLQGKEADPLRVLRQLSLLGLFQPGTKGVTANDLLQLLVNPKNGENLLSPAETKDILRLVKIFETINQHNHPVSFDKNDCLLFPCFFDDDSGWGEWLLSFSDDPNKPGGQQRPYTMTFMLEMSELGDLQLQIALSGDSIKGVFYVDNQEVLTHMNKNLNELTGILEKLGFSPVNLSCQVVKQGKLDLLKNILTEKSGYGNLPLLDVTI